MSKSILTEIALCSFLWFTSASAIAEPSAYDIETYFKPYVATNNFSGSVLIERPSGVVFAKSYGFANLREKVPNRLNTRYHIASLSILFTSAAVLRLIDEGKLDPKTRVSELVPGVPNGEKITIQELLDQNSGLPDANDLPGYENLLLAHQTPESLIDFIRGKTPYAEPGLKSDREEHSGQNLLALIVEKKTGQKFANAMKELVFDPLGMRDSGIDDDTKIGGSVAQGYRPSGVAGLKAAQSIHWSAKTGNGSAYSTVGDEWKWLQGILQGNFLSAKSRAAFINTTNGYGWTKVDRQRLGERVFVSNGRAPGFSSHFEYFPKDGTLIVVLANIEHDANPEIVHELAAFLRGKAYEQFSYQRVPLESVGHPQGKFSFGSDFYRPNATLQLVSGADGVALNWPGGPSAPLLPIAKDQFMDRYYWTRVTLVHDSRNRLIELDYGKFRGAIRPRSSGALLFRMPS